MKKASTHKRALGFAAAAAVAASASLGAMPAKHGSSPDARAFHRAEIVRLRASVIDRYRLPGGAVGLEPGALDAAAPTGRASEWHQLLDEAEQAEQKRRARHVATGAGPRFAKARDLYDLERSRDRRALALARGGEPEGFELFYHWRHPLMLRNLYKPHAHSPDEAEDVAAVAWGRFWSAWSEAGEEPDDPFVYLKAIARHYMADQWRRYGSQRNDPGTLVSLQDPAPRGGRHEDTRLYEDFVGLVDDAAASQHDWEAFARKTYQLPPLIRSAVEETIRQAVGLPSRSLVEVAGELGVSRSTAYRQLEKWRREWVATYLEASREAGAELGDVVA